MTAQAEMEVQRSLGRVEAGITALSERFDAFTEQESQRTNQLFDRISALERWKSKSLGYLAGATAVLVALIAMARTLLT